MNDNSNNNNDLNELNSILFDTLRGVTSGEIDTKKANSVIGLSNALVNNAKVQIQAMKLTGQRTPTKFMSLTESTGKPTDKHEAMMVFAKSIGYDSVAEAIAEESKPVFIKKFETWYAE